MLESLSRWPRWLHGLVLAGCVLGLALSMFLTDFRWLGSRSLGSLPAEYWLFLALDLMFLLGADISLHFLSKSVNSLVASMANVGAGCIISFLFRIIDIGWSSNTLAIILVALVFFSAALLVRTKEAAKRQAH